MRGGLDQLPWSEGPLNAETRVVERWLVRMVEERGWWSVASQPACDGARSEDKVFGWGPKKGFVFQKSFVEFWMPEKDWRENLRPRLANAEANGLVSWYATPNPLRGAKRERTAGVTAAAKSTDTAARTTHANGASSTSPATEADADTLFDTSAPLDAVHAVTWGSFPGKEIVSTTIIEAMSFRAWADEAFGIWREWERCHAPGSRAREVLKECGDQLWLVNVIGHVYQEPDMLWELLLEA